MRNKRIYYIVGAYGCGKTSSVKKIAEQRDDVYPILEDDIILDFLRSPNVYLRSCVNLPVYMYRIKKAIRDREEPIILVDGHPMHTMFYLQCFNEMEHGISVDIRNILDFGKFHNNLVKIMENMWAIYPQTVIHVELPFDRHWNMVLERFKRVREETGEFPEEADDWYLETIRRIFHENAKIYAEEMYRAEYIKVDNLEVIDGLVA